MNVAEKKISKLFILLALTVLGVSTVTFGVDIPPESVHITTPVYHPAPSVKFPLGTYKYTVSWQGIPAAEAAITLDQEGMRYKINASARTYSGIDIFYKLRYTADGTLNSADLLPLQTNIKLQENSRLRLTEILLGTLDRCERTLL